MTWFVIANDHKWFERLVVGTAVADALMESDLHFPKIDADQTEISQTSSTKKEIKAPEL